MIIDSLHIENFRNHRSSMVSFSPGINVLAGPNGAGKTNLLDALHVLFMSRSFVTTADANLPARDAAGFAIEAACRGQVRPSFQLRCTYAKADGKQFFVNRSPLEKLTDLIGLVPVVVLSPDDRKLTKEGPAERRSFLDSMISQASRPYLMDLVEYRRVLKQRNRLLATFTGSPADLPLLLEPWDVQLARYGAAIIRKRIEVLRVFQENLAAVYEALGLPGIAPELHYRPEEEAGRTGDASVLHLEEDLLVRLQEKRAGDLEQGTTRTGPHRDDMVFALGGSDLRKFGSQGQHRLFAIALKLAQLAWYASVLDETPVLILDDMFGELDREKTAAIARYLGNAPFQTFISVAKEDLIVPYLEGVRETALYRVENGSVFSV